MEDTGRTDTMVDDDVAIRISGLKKEYRLGMIGSGTLQKDLQSWWARVRGKEDPNSIIGSNSRERIIGERLLALNGIDLTVRRGETLGIIGKNGAGKSTLLKVLARITSPSAGMVELFGRVTSMLEVVILLIISSMYSGIFRETKMLDQMHEKLAGFCRRFGRFHTLTLTSIVVGGLFCNQTISILMCRDLLQEAYERTGGTSQEFAIDMENSVILICCFIPWAVGAMVPRQFLGVGVGCMVYAVYMYLVPLTYWFLKPVFAAFRSDRRAHVQQGN